MEKDFTQRVLDLESHALLLIEACDRFSKDYKFDEIKNIGVRLRVIVGSKKGDGLLFDLATETKDTFTVMKLNQIGKLQITEFDEKTGKPVQQIERKALLTQAVGRLPIVFLEEQDKSLYSSVGLKEWLEDGFLLDWQVPGDGKHTPAMKRFTPQFLIERYTGQEGAHADSTHGIFEGPIENVSITYTVENGKQINIPIVYNYLHQIGAVIAKVSLNYVKKHKKEFKNK